MRSPLSRWTTLSLLSVALLLSGCGGGGGDDDPGPGVGDPSGKYLIEGYFGGAVIPGGFAVWVGRLDAGDTSAKECQITINGTSLSRADLLSTESDAFYSILEYDYAPNTAYTVTATLDGRTATCSFTSPETPWVEITAPADNSLFEPGTDIDLAWSYDSGTPDNAYVGAMCDEEDEPILADQTLAGSATTYTIAGSVTDDWGDYADVLITVDLGEKVYLFTGDLAYAGSAVATVLPGDAIIVVPGTAPDTTWTVTALLTDTEIDADGAGTTTVRAIVTDEFFNSCSDGTVVNWSAVPAGSVTFDSPTSTTLYGEATATITAGTTPGTVTITAVARGDSGSADLTLSAVTQVAVGAGAYPVISWTPNDSMVELLVRKAGLEIGNLRWSITGLISSPVTYGTVPGALVQTWPLLGAAPNALVTGEDYRVYLVDAAGDTASVLFTR